MFCKQSASRIDRLSGFVILPLMLGMSGCSTPVQNQAASPSPTLSAASALPPANRPLVVATSTDICDVTRQIAADTIELKCLIAQGQDVHEYQPKPEDSKAIEQAKLILYGGYNFEPQLVKLIKAAANTAPKIAVHETAVPTPQQFQEHGETVTDPHVFHSAANGVKIAAVISNKLSQLAPNNAAVYATNTQKLTDELTQIDTWIKSQIATIPAAQRKLVTTHDAFGYYAKAYDIELAGALQGVSTEEKPTPTRVAELVTDIRATGVPTIFAENTINPKLIQAVAREANVKVSERELFGDGLGEVGSGAETYQTMLIANTQTIVQGLKGQFTPFQLKPSNR